MSAVNKYNENIANKLEEVAKILTVQNANPFRIDAYRRAAETIRSLDRSLETIVNEEGFAGLDDLPGIGDTSVKLVWSPPWSPDLMTEEAKDELGIW